MLLDAARRAYSETRGLPAAKHAVMFDNCPEEILKWYCVWIAMRTQIRKRRVGKSSRQASRSNRHHSMTEGLRHHIGQASLVAHRNGAKYGARYRRVQSIIIWVKPLEF
jgi:hypothetical protein